MKKGIDISFTKESLEAFEASVRTIIRNVETGTKKATTKACQEIIAESIRQVPEETGTLAASAFYEVLRRTDLSSKSYKYEAILGYGGNGDPVNPKTGKPASYYMVVVHEDLSLTHFKGNAKYLEIPMLEYGSKKFNDTFSEYLKSAL